MTNWYEKAEDELVNQVNDGEITEREFRQGMRDLNAEYRQGEEDAAEYARENYRDNN